MGETTLRPRTAWLNRNRATRRATIAGLALVAVALPASAAADHPASGGGADGVPGAVERALGGEVRALDNGLYRVKAERGYSFTTHGPDPKTDEVASTLTPGQPERAPTCIDNPATDYYQEVLYAYPSSGTNDVVAQRPVIQAQVRRNNWLINDESLASGGPEADFKVRCEADNSIKVTAYPVTVAGGGTSATFTEIVNSAKAAGFGNAGTDSNVDYTIFYDGGGSFCGVGYFFSDESAGVDNLNNNPGFTGAGYGATYRGCWFGRTSIHENAHNQGAAQYNAPNSTGSGAHCNERNDILCYVDGGDRNQSLIDCPITPPDPSDWFYDCNWNTYFDSVTEPGEWLATHWNIGSSVNRFIAFGTDTRTPNTTITGAPSGPTNSAAISFVSSEEPSTFQCSVGAVGGTPSYSGCVSPRTYTGLSDGTYEFHVRATDAASNTDSTPASATFTFDGTAPDTQIDSGPSGAITTPSAQFTFSVPGGEPNVSFECRIDGDPFEDCTSPHTVTFPQGPHTFAVRAIDAAGNADPTPATRALTVDSVAPETKIDSGPSGGTTTTTPQFTFSVEGGESGVTYACSTDAAPFTPCTSPLAVTVAQGLHSFAVRASDALGNVDATPATRVFVVDSIPPETTLTSTPKPIVRVKKKAKVTFAFTVSESDSASQCRVDGAPFAPCSSPHTKGGLARGGHTFQVRSIDPFLNVEQTPASYSFKVKKKRRRR